MGERRGIGAAGIRISIQKSSQLLLFCKILLPLLSFHIFATIPLDFLVWAISCHILPRHATIGPLMAGWVSIKWRGLTPHLHHKQGWISIKWRGLTPHLHHDTVALRGIGAAGVRTSTQKPSFYFLYYPFTIFHIFATNYYHLSWLLGLGNLLPHIATIGPLLARWVSIKWRGLTPHLHHKQGDLYKMEGSNPPPPP